MVRRIHFLAGQTFTRLKVQRYLGRNLWECTCECGRSARVNTSNLVTGKTRSCGCFDAERRKERFTTHGMRRTKTYSIWSAMLQRCENANNDDYPNYGGRGIKVCERWHDFASFFADMGECPAGFSIDRAEANGHYEPANCRWIPMPDQSRTRRVALKTTALAPEIKRLRSCGYSQQRIADAVGIDQTTVSRVLAGRTGKAPRIEGA